MEILHTSRVDQQGELERHLDSLPQDLIDIIADKVLADQPFSRVRSLCACERWTDFLLSNQYLLYLDMGRLLLFNFRRRVWESVSLDFIQLEGRRLSNCAASDGGLLLLVTECGEFFVCNPLTRRYKRFQKPRQGDLVEDSLLWTRALPWTHIALTHALAEMLASSDTGQFKVVLSTIDLNFRRTTFVYDSRDNDWRMIEDFAGQTDFFFTRPRAKWKGNLYVAGYSCKLQGTNVLKYDFEQEQWRSTEAPDTRAECTETQCTVTECTCLDPRITLQVNGTLLMGFLCRDPLSFLEVQDTVPTLSESESES